MDGYRVLALFITVVTLPYIHGDASCKLSNDRQVLEFQRRNSTSPISKTPHTTKLMDRNESRKNKEVFGSIPKMRTYEKDGRRGGTPDPPRSGENPGDRRVPTETTTISGDLHGSSQKTIDPRFTTQLTTRKKKIRTTPARASFAEDCDYLVNYCYKAYKTGKLCARTMFYTYYTFENYCKMDYVNCMERFEIWQVVHMGPCFNIKVLTEYLHYPVEDDYFLDQDTITQIV